MLLIGSVSVSAVCVGVATAAGETCGGVPATIVGTPAPDLLTGTPGNDVIVGGGGADTIDAGAGDDLICPGAGDGEPPEVDGDDEVDAGGGDDVVLPSDGADAIIGGAGDDALESGPGDDVVRAGPGRDYTDAGPGSDFVFSTDGDDYVEGGDGGDVIQVEGGTTYLSGGWGDDIIRGGTGADYMDGGPGDDFALGQGASSGQDYYDGGTGADRLSGSNDPEYLDGGEGADRLLAAGGSDYLDGGGGDDELEGGAGADYFDGGDGGDALLAYDGEVDTQFDCGPGTDTLDGDLTDSTVVRNACEDDSDGDGLLDDWEELGYDGDGDGNPEVDLPAIGADSSRKDIFVQMVWLEDAGGLFGIGAHTHQPDPAALDPIVRAFDQAPVPNPGGVTGIELHILEAGSVPETDELEVLDYENCSTGSWDWRWLDAIKEKGDGDSSYLTDAQARIFHFALVGHQARQCDDELFGGMSRNSLGSTATSDAVFWRGASDFFVAAAGRTERAVATTFMHELGHNLGLGHGGVTVDADGESLGADHTNRKPNHLSVMNYWFSQRGVRVDSLGSSDSRLDYSRFGGDDLPALDEREVSEPAGLSGSLAVTGYGSKYRCPDGEAATINDLHAPVDWNCDGDGGVDSQLFDINLTGNLDERGEPIIEDHPLTTANEWDALVYRGGAVGQAGPPVVLPTSTDSVVAPEPSLEELAADRISTRLVTAVRRWAPGSLLLVAALREAVSRDPLPEREIRFRNRRGHDLCRAVTDDSGVARCVVRWRALGWIYRWSVAEFAGDDLLRGSRTRMRRWPHGFWYHHSWRG